MSIKEKSITIDPFNCFYREVTTDGDKPPVLLIHGLPAHSYTWRTLLLDLEEANLRAIAPDLIGFGSSSKPSKREFGYTPEDYLKILTAILAALEIEKCSLIVQGFLASVGLQYALRYPEQIEKLILLNTPISTAVKLPWQMQQWGLPLVGEMLTQDPLQIDRSLEKGSGFVIEDNDLDRHRQPFLKSSSAGRSLMCAVRNLQLSRVMAELESGLMNWKKQTLIIWGMQDPWLEATQVEKLAQSKPNIELVKLEAAKHYPQEHFSGEIALSAINFLRRQTL